MSWQLESKKSLQTVIRFCIGTSSLIRWSKPIEPFLIRDKLASKIARMGLILDVATYPDSFQYEQAQRIGVSARGICHTLKGASFSYKNIIASKSKPPIPRRLSEQDPAL